MVHKVIILREKQADGPRGVTESKSRARDHDELRGLAGGRYTLSLHEQYR